MGLGSERRCEGHRLDGVKFGGEGSATFGGADTPRGVFEQGDFIAQGRRANRPLLRRPCRGEGNASVALGIEEAPGAVFGLTGRAGVLVGLLGVRPGIAELACEYVAEETPRPGLIT